MLTVGHLYYEGLGLDKRKKTFRLPVIHSCFALASSVIKDDSSPMTRVTHTIVTTFTLDDARFWTNVKTRIESGSVSI